MDPTGCLLQEDHKFYWRCKARLSFKYFYHEGYHCIEVVPQVIPSSISVMELIRHLGRKTANDLPEEEQQQEEERVVVEEEEVKVAEPHRVLLGQLGRRLYLDSDILLEAAQLEAKNHTMNATLYSSSSSSTTLLPPLYSSSSSTTLLPPLYSSSSSTHLGEDVVETVAVGEMMIKEKEEEQEEGGSNEEDGPQVDDKVTTTTLPLALALGGGGGGGGGGGVGISNPRSLRIRGNALLVANHITSRLLVDHVAILNGSKAPEDAVFFDDRNYPSSSSSSSTTTTPLLTTPPHGLRPCQVSSERLYNRWEVCDKLDELVRLQVELREAVHKAESIARCISENSQAVGLTTTTSTTTTSNTTSNTMAGVAGGVVNATTPPAVALPPPSLHDYNTSNTTTTTTSPSTATIGKGNHGALSFTLPSLPNTTTTATTATSSAIGSAIVSNGLDVDALAMPMNHHNDNHHSDDSDHSDSDDDHEGLTLPFLPLATPTSSLILTTEPPPSLTLPPLLPHATPSIPIPANSSSANSSSGSLRPHYRGPTLA
eukprot:scaffold233_cov174-Ochromonas_danica.AAC.21